MRSILGLFVATLCLVGSTAEAQQRLTRSPRARIGPNVVMIIADDIGVDMVNVYGEAPIAAPCTPSLDAMASKGLLFRNAWGNPVCSPTRASILTGRYGFRTGMGEVLKSDGSQLGMPVEEFTLPEALRYYHTAMLGKWHLAYPQETMGDGQGSFHPLNSGFDYYAGSLFNIFQQPITGVIPGCTGPYTYDNWVKAVNGVESCTTTYATTDTVDEAVSAIRSLPEPWFVVVSFNAVHLPTHKPPAHLCPGVTGCSCPTGATPSIADEVKEMAEAMDTEIGRLLSEISTEDPEAYVFFTSDNGTEPLVSEGPPGGCFDPLKAKGTVYEPGVRVPLIVNGPTVAVGEVDAIVNLSDLYATVLELSGRPHYSPDSISLVPYFDGTTTPLRQTVYTERFWPNGAPIAPVEHHRAIRNEQFKLLRFSLAGGTEYDEFYDLVNDPCESTNLLPLTPGSIEETNYLALEAELVLMGVD